MFSIFLEMITWEEGEKINIYIYIGGQTRWNWCAFMGAVIRFVFDSAGIFSTTELTEHMHYYKGRIYILKKGGEEKKKVRDFLPDLLMSIFKLELFFSFFFFFVFSTLSLTHPHLPPPRHQRERHRGGSGGICPATSLPSGWPGGGFGGVSSSAWRPACLLLLRSSPATPSAASPAAPRCPAVVRQTEVNILFAKLHHHNSFYQKKKSFSCSKSFQARIFLNQPQQWESSVS